MLFKDLDAERNAWTSNRTSPPAKVSENIKVWLNVHREGMKNGWTMACSRIFFANGKPASALNDGDETLTA